MGKYNFTVDVLMELAGSKIINNYTFLFRFKLKRCLINLPFKFKISLKLN